MSAVVCRAFWKPEQITAYLGGVPKAKMWLLDLFGDSNPIWPKTESFHGHPYWLCTLLNFGGREYSATAGAPRSVALSTAACPHSILQSIFQQRCTFGAVADATVACEQSKASRATCRVWGRVCRPRSRTLQSPVLGSPWRVSGPSEHHLSLLLRLWVS